MTVDDKDDVLKCTGRDEDIPQYKADLRDVLTTQACLGAYCRGLSGPQHLPLWYFTQ